MIYFLFYLSVALHYRPVCMQVRSLDMHLPHDLNCKTEKKVILEARPAHLEHPQALISVATG